MGMSIDESVRYLRLMLGGMKYAVKYWADKDKEESDIEQTNIEAVTTALDIMRNYQMMQADYNARLKADMVAMLTELSMEIGEIEDGYTEFDEENKRSLTMIPLESVERLIDGEINSLKGEQE